MHRDISAEFVEFKEQEKKSKGRTLTEIEWAWCVSWNHIPQSGFLNAVKKTAFPFIMYPRCTGSSFHPVGL